MLERLLGPVWPLVPILTGLFLLVMGAALYGLRRARSRCRREDHPPSPGYIGCALGALVWTERCPSCNAECWWDRRLYRQRLKDQCRTEELKAEPAAWKQAKAFYRNGRSPRPPVYYAKG